MRIYINGITVGEIKHGRFRSSNPNFDGTLVNGNELFLQVQGDYVMTSRIKSPQPPSQPPVRPFCLSENTQSQETICGREKDPTTYSVQAFLKGIISGETKICDWCATQALTGGKNYL